jgi:hypothetical protein
MSRAKSFLILTVVIVFAPAALADNKPVRPVKEWSGSVDDAELAKEAPEFITEAKELEKLWKSWKLADKVPEVDFDKELVVVTTTVGSNLSLFAKLDDKGNLTVGGIATQDIAPGFRYVIATLSRDGIKTVNGKELSRK